MRITVKFYDNFLYHGPLSINGDVIEKHKVAFQNVTKEISLREALDTYLKSAEFLQLITASWKWPYLTQEEAGLSLDATPTHLQTAIVRWFNYSLTRTDIDVHRSTPTTKEQLVYTVSDIDDKEYEDCHLDICLEYDEAVPELLRREHLVPTTEELQALRDKDWSVFDFLS